MVGTFGGAAGSAWNIFKTISGICTLREGSGAGSDPESERGRCPGLKVMPVVLGGGWPGIFAAQPSATGWKRILIVRNPSLSMGKKVASEVCTIVDDGTLPFRRGSLNVDDEGTPTSHYGP